MSPDNVTTNKDTGPGGAQDEGKRASRILVPALTLALVLIITGGLFYLGRYQSDLVERFEGFGYLGVFVISLISNATVILPVPGILLFIPVVNDFNPALLGLVGATGGAIGEITGYLAGLSGRGLIRPGKTYTRIERWMKKYGMWGIFGIAAAPMLPVDVAGIIAGAMRLPWWRFLLPVWAGKTVKYVVLMLLAGVGWPFVSRLLGG